MRTEKIVARTLIHYRDGVEVGDRRMLEGLRHQPAMVEKRGAVTPLRRPRRWREAAGRLEWECTGSLADIEVVGKPPQRRFARLPALKRGQQVRSDCRRRDGAAAVLRDDQQTPVDRSVVVSRKLHDFSATSRNAGSNYPSTRMNSMRPAS
jgi:hypothetical protein